MLVVFALSLTGANILSGIIYLALEGFTACSSAETVGSSFADFVVGIHLQSSQSLQCASQWKELFKELHSELSQSLPPFGASQG